MDKAYDPGNIETRWYRYWEDKQLFCPSGEGAPYCIMIPPPNVTGTLHMGHGFQTAIMDALTRYHRMLGHDTLWQPGTDHAGIATQMVVERQLEAVGTTRHDLGRESFVERVWTWRETSGGTIVKQQRRLGASVDWTRERFTMDEGMSKAVLEVFVQLYDEGLIYRGKRLVNWDPVLHTALSDLEVLPTEEDGQLWHLRYPVIGPGPGMPTHIVVATTRPETMLGDTAVAVHPEDERFSAMIGMEVELPLTGRRLPIVGDDYVDPEFGSGCVKITPAHDFNDYEIGVRHKLPMINILTADAALNDNVPEAYRGLDRFVARERVVADLDAAGLLANVDTHRMTVPRGDRSHVVVEPYLTDQWYVRIAPLAQPAIEAVESGAIRFIPAAWSKTYFEWMRNIQDWCISRQLWWGHRIPAWYDAQQNIYVGRDEAEVRRKHGLGAEVSLRQDEDVLDTWFSSALWPFSTLGWPEETAALKTFYPSSVLVTGFDIIFFWVARMIMMGLKFKGDVPFHEVYITGLIRDHDGQKMSKSKGNVLDPIDLIDGIDLESLVEKRTGNLMQPQLAKRIEKATRREFPAGIPAFGTDALRFTFASLATTGRDIRFDLGRIEGYRNFCNKLWNAARYVLMSCADQPLEGKAEPTLPDRWIRSRLGVAIAKARKHIEGYRFDLAAKAMYEFVWHEYCDWYLELSKAVLQNEQTDAATKATTRRTLLEVLEASLRMLHPIMPFITEDIWQRVAPMIEAEGDTIMLAPYPDPADFARAETAESETRWLTDFVLGVRQIRGEYDIAPSKPLPVLLQGAAPRDLELMTRLAPFLQFLARLESWRALDEEPPPSATALHGNMRILVPLAGLIDRRAELDRLGKQLQKRHQDRDRAQKKLANEKFVANAPAEVVDKERQRLAQVGVDIAQLEEQIKRLETLN